MNSWIVILLAPGAQFFRQQESVSKGQDVNFAQFSRSVALRQRVDALVSEKSVSLFKNCCSRYLYYPCFCYKITFSSWLHFRSESDQAQQWPHLPWHTSKTHENWLKESRKLRIRKFWRDWRRVAMQRSFWRLNFESELCFMAMFDELTVVCFGPGEQSSHLGQRSKFLWTCWECQAALFSRGMGIRIVWYWCLSRASRKVRISVVQSQGWSGYDG